MLYLYSWCNLNDGELESEHLAVVALPLIGAYEGCGLESETIILGSAGELESDRVVVWDVDEGRAYVPDGCVRRCVVDAYSSQGVRRRRKGMIYRWMGKGKIYDATAFARKTLGKQGNLFGIES